MLSTRSATLLRLGLSSTAWEKNFGADGLPAPFGFTTMASWLSLLFLLKPLTERLIEALLNWNHELDSNQYLFFDFPFSRS